MPEGEEKHMALWGRCEAPEKEKRTTKKVSSTPKTCRSTLGPP